MGRPQGCAGGASRAGPQIICAHLLAQLTTSSDCGPPNKRSDPQTNLPAGPGAFNIIPDSVELKGTIRSFSKAAFGALRARVTDVFTSTAAMYGCTASVAWSEVGWVGRWRVAGEMAACRRPQLAAGPMCVNVLVLATTLCRHAAAATPARASASQPSARCCPPPSGALSAARDRPPGDGGGPGRGGKGGGTRKRCRAGPALYVCRWADHDNGSWWGMALFEGRPAPPASSIHAQGRILSFFLSFWADHVWARHDGGRGPALGPRGSTCLRGKRPPAPLPAPRGANRTLLATSPPHPPHPHPPPHPPPPPHTHITRAHCTQRTSRSSRKRCLLPL